MYLNFSEHDINRLLCGCSTINKAITFIIACSGIFLWIGEMKKQPKIFWK